MKYVPHDYQKFAAEHIINNPVAALFLDMGLGKTVITLSAIQELMYERFEVRKVLVIAPLRVGRDTWPQEIEKWDHLKGLKYSVAIGTETERKVALMAKASIYIINRENVEWLVKNCTFDFDMNQAVRLWNEIFQIVKENCSTDYSEAAPQDDLMERLLRARERR